MMTVSVGMPVDDFSAPSTAGEFVLSALRGRHVVLYFYPKDNTPGCTTQGCDFGAAHAQFRRAGAEVFGVSRDSVKSHQGFKEKQAFPFALIADPDEAVCTLFDVIRMKNMYGKQVRGIERSTFLIDAAGVLRQQWRGVKVPGHVDAVLAAVKALA
jgi:thioredoxin-dependent peroxiredoxin